MWNYIPFYAKPYCSQYVVHAIYVCCKLQIIPDWCNWLAVVLSCRGPVFEPRTGLFRCFMVHLRSLFILCLTWYHTVEVCSKIFLIDCPHCTLISQEIFKKSTETYISICRELKARSIDMFSFSLLHIFTQLFPVKL